MRARETIAHAYPALVRTMMSGFGGLADKPIRLFVHIFWKQHVMPFINRGRKGKTTHFSFNFDRYSMNPEVSQGNRQRAVVGSDTPPRFGTFFTARSGTRKTIEHQEQAKW